MSLPPLGMTRWPLLFTKWGLPHRCVRTVVSRSYRADNDCRVPRGCYPLLDIILDGCPPRPEGLLLSVIEHSVVLGAIRW